MDNKWYKRSGWLAGLSLCLSMVACNKSDQIIVDVSQEGAEVPSSLYGVFSKKLHIPGMAVYMRKWCLTVGLKTVTCRQGLFTRMDMPYR